jgi:uncharacterized radical SAM superfamily Fe-S cluster-containing enzyme
MATYIFKDNGKMVPITRFVDIVGILEYLDELGNKLKEKEGVKALPRKFWSGTELLFKLNSFIDKEKAPKDFSIGKVIYNAFVKHDYRALGEFHQKSLFVGLMHFQDLYNYDIERVKRCCIHYAMSDGRIVPFCAFNVIPEWYRDKGQKSQGISIGKWEKQTGKNIRDDLYKRKAKELEETKLYKDTYKGFIKQAG